MRWSRLLLLLVPVGPMVAGFGGCGVVVNPGGGGAGGGGVSVSSSSSSGITTTTSTNPGSGGMSAGHLAGPCTTDADCGSDLECVGPGAADPTFQGGAPGGFCTKTCMYDAECAKVGGVCYQPDPSAIGRCTLACTLGPPIAGVAGLFTPLSGVKCRGREDVRCLKTGSKTGACVPTCGTDEQCAGGKCDPRTAACTAAPSTGSPTGAFCDPGQTPTTCAGLCVGFETGVAMCSEPCVLGAAGPSSKDCGGAEHGLCAFHPPTNGAGDTGFCTPSCAAQSDCQWPHFWCFGVPGLTEVLHRGYCFAATPCPGGQSDCTPADAGAGPSYTCTKTSEGPLCLDTAFALDVDAGAGDAGPQDAGPIEAGAPDAGPEDGGSGDAGGGDAGPYDGGDAGDGG